ncbi:hypothetical protein E3J62_00395 [candidate division TA06 bacterium]|uniref:DNA methylase N-4/N-6 domain-containing protein n=1 Tax=candidate division TA06 bacterium TaxID=2250710 RepID=A0A523UZ02_UNCT6|nr:MAG: hypothetical protein E3J62_00395 [candidate division TA06 bacterium]
MKVSNGKASNAANSNLAHINRQIPPEAHTPMYNWHKFWSRKTWNVIAEYIKAYCPEGGIVFDPFAGSGVTALEALKNNRKAIVCDILPIATEIIRLTVKPISLIRLRKAYERVEDKVKDKILSLYQTKCRRCGKEIPLNCAIWEGSECKEIRYAKCPFCGDRQAKNCTPDSSDRLMLRKMKKAKIQEWYPKQRLYYPGGQPFKEKQKYESIDQLFTKRNLQALAWLIDAIEQETSRELRDFLRIAFTSMVHLCTRMCPISEAGHFTPFSSAWTQHSYWYPSGPNMEQNVWLRFQSSILGHQGLIKAKEESNRYFKPVRFARSYHEVLKGEADVFIYTGSCFDLMGKISKEPGGDSCIDYIFTDPPYGGSLQFGELAYLWASWLRKDKGYLEKMVSDEVVENQRQGKSFDVYHSLLSRSFDEMYTLLKPDSYATVTFHNPTFKVRNATIYAAVFAGFEYQKIHHQELARPSAKSLLQPFGSAQGDFYFRFYKGSAGEKPLPPEEIDEKRFEKIVVETTIKVLAERGEETPYTIIINAIDPQLARHGYFSELKSGLDVKSVLKAHIGSEFVLVPVELRKTKGQLWWLRNPAGIPHLKTVPLSERIEQTVLRKVQQKGRITFTEVWDAVSTEFPNALTSDSISIKGALQAYARPTTRGYWLMRQDAGQKEIVRAHTEILAILAETGRKLGYVIWIGKPEHQHKITVPPGKPNKLKQYVDLKDTRNITNAHNHSVVANIDLLWIKDNTISKSFEVEATTMMTEALNRGSNIDRPVPKFLVIPHQREQQLLRKLRSPMFAERFKNDNWHLLYFETLREGFRKRKAPMNISDMVNKKLDKKLKTDEQPKQLKLEYT